MRCQRVFVLVARAALDASEPPAYAGRVFALKPVLRFNRLYGRWDCNGPGKWGRVCDFRAIRRGSTTGDCSRSPSGLSHLNRWAPRTACPLAFCFGQTHWRQAASGTQSLRPKLTSTRNGRRLRSLRRWLGEAAFVCRHRGLADSRLTERSSCVAIPCLGLPQPDFLSSPSRSASQWYLVSERARHVPRWSLEVSVESADQLWICRLRLRELHNKVIPQSVSKRREPSTRRAPPSPTA